MSPWIKAARLKTLPLALSGILLGYALSHLNGAEDQVTKVEILVLALLTATMLQILSNYANDYGDFKKGTDIQAKRKDRALASGLISESSMKIVLIFLVLFILILGISLIQLSGLFTQKQLHITGLDFASSIFLNPGVCLLILGIFAIIAAIAYTVGKNAYGYFGLGDLFVLLFFGLLPIVGMGILMDVAITSEFIIAGFGIGFLSVGVLNINNYRDINSDKQHGKKTIAVRLGAKKTLLYHKLLLVLGALCIPISFIEWEKHFFQWEMIKAADATFLIGIFSPIFISLSSHFNSLKQLNPGDSEPLNNQLKKLSIIILATVLLYLFLTFFIYDFLGNR